MKLAFSLTLTNSFFLAFISITTSANAYLRYQCQYTAFVALIGTGIADVIRSWSLPFYFLSCFANAAKVFFFNLNLPNRYRDR